MLASLLPSWLVAKYANQFGMPTSCLILILSSAAAFMQRHLAPGETEENSPYLEQLRCASNAALTPSSNRRSQSPGGKSQSSLPLTLPIPVSSTSNPEPATVTRAGSSSRNRSGSVQLIDKHRFSAKTRNRSSSTIFTSSPLPSPRRKDKDKGEKDSGQYCYSLHPYSFPASPELEAAKKSVRNAWDCLSSADKLKLKEFMLAICEEQ